MQVRKSFFDGPSPPPMHFMMAAGPLPDNAEVAVLLGLHPKLGGHSPLFFPHFRAHSPSSGHIPPVYGTFSHIPPPSSGRW
eukprot:1912194-Rhodomonas_salina.1